MVQKDKLINMNSIEKFRIKHSTKNLDVFTFRYNGSVWQEIGRVQNMAQS